LRPYLQTLEYNTAIEKLYTKLGRAPDHDEISAAMGVSLEEVRNYEQWSYNAISLATPIKDNTTLTLGDTLRAQDPNPEELASAQNLKNEINKNIYELTPSQAIVIKGLFEDERTLTELADEHEVSYQAMQNRKNYAMKQLKQKLIDKGITTA
jgi:DNA-directed RNA polymerase sigma subunit (sigma70/sigma32)